MQQKKTVKSFKQLSEINRRELFDKKGNLKPLNKKFAVSFARQLATGFDIDLRKDPSKSQYRRSREVIKEFYSSIRQEKIKIVRPSKQNRKYYAELAAMPKNFKVFAMPVIDSTDKFRVIGKGKNKRIKRQGIFTSTDFFKFRNKNQLIKNPKKETDNLFKEITDIYGKKKYAVKIKCGKGEYQVLYEDKKANPAREIQNWLDIYGKNEVKKWCLGFQTYTFKNQIPLPTKTLAKKGMKKPKMKK